VAAAALALAACGTGPSPSHVASLDKNGGRGSGDTTTTQPTGNATRLLDEWAACMRRHGDSGQADPTIDANDDIDITWNPATTGGIYGTYKGGQGNSGPGQYCRSYLNAAQTALGGNQQHPPDQATLLKFSECMRANGIADFPDPANGTLVLNMRGANSDLSPTNPAFQNAAKLCEQRTGAHVPFAGGTPPPGIIKLNGAGP
jgi:hypothetical protein